MKNRFLYLSLFLASGLGGCAYSAGGNNQDIEFVAQDAENVKCSVLVDKLRYQVFPPQTLNIKKSPKDMIVTCNAPGNRSVEINVPAKFSKRSLWGSPAGVAWDYASESLYRYPSVVAVDFSQEVPTPNELPSHYAHDIADPDSYDLEDVGASVPRLNSDKNKQELPLLERGQERTEQGEGVSAGAEQARDLKSIVEDLSGADTAVSSPGSSEPVQLYPGQ